MESPDVVHVLGAPVAALGGRGQVAHRLGLPVVLKTDHGVVSVGVDHHRRVAHPGGLPDPVLPLGQVPGGATAEEVVPVEDDAITGEGPVGEVPVFEGKGFVRLFVALLAEFEIVVKWG